MFRKVALGATLAVLLTAASHGQPDTGRTPTVTDVKLPMTQAIQTAEAQGKGKAISVEFDGKGPEYEVKILTADGKLVKYKLDANSGQLRGTENEIFERFFTRLKPQILQAAATTLTQAIAVAEQSVGGKAIGAEVERESADRVLYEVSVLKSDRTTQKVKIDGTSGQITSDR